MKSPPLRSPAAGAPLADVLAVTAADGISLQGMRERARTFAVPLLTGTTTTPPSVSRAQRCSTVANPWP